MSDVKHRVFKEFICLCVSEKVFSKHFYYKLKVFTLVKCAPIKDLMKFDESFFFLDCTSRIIVSMLFSTEKMTPLMLEILHDISP